jgi:hypothetical protein
MTDQELKDLVASLAVSQAATDLQMRETDRKMQSTERQIRELGKQIGGLGNKFGSFTEGLMLPSVNRLLEEHFGVDNFQMRVRSKRDGRWLEIDGFGYANGTRNIGFIIEVKSHLSEDAIAQTQRIMEEFSTFYPQYRGMTLYGVIATVDAGTNELQRKVAEAGLYLVSVHDEIAALQTPDGFAADGFAAKPVLA